MKPILKCTFPEFWCLPGEAHSQWGKKSKPFKNTSRKMLYWNVMTAQGKPELGLGKEYSSEIGFPLIMHLPTLWGLHGPSGFLVCTGLRHPHPNSCCFKWGENYGSCDGMSGKVPAWHFSLRNFMIHFCTQCWKNSRGVTLPAGRESRLRPHISDRWSFQRHCLWGLFKNSDSYYGNQVSMVFEHIVA